MRGAVSIWLVTLMGLVTLPATLIAVIMVGRASQGNSTWLAAAWWAGSAIAAWVLTWPLRHLARRNSSRQEATQTMVEQIAQERRWKVSSRVAQWESGWKSHPFVSMRNVVVSPGAQGKSGGLVVGVGYLEGDLAVANTEVKMIASRIAFIDTGVPLPPAYFVGQGFKDEVSKLFGGRDLDVESDAFNREWRILTDDPAGTHGVLQPRMIEYLIGARQRRTAINLDGSRIMVWDDGTRKDVDLAERLEFLEGFVELLPGFLKPKR